MSIVIHRKQCNIHLLTTPQFVPKFPQKNPFQQERGKKVKRILSYLILSATYETNRIGNSFNHCPASSPSRLSKFGHHHLEHKKSRSNDSLIFYICLPVDKFDGVQDTIKAVRMTHLPFQFCALLHSLVVAELPLDALILCITAQFHLLNSHCRRDFFSGPFRLSFTN